ASGTEVAESLQLPTNRHRHLMPGGIAVRQDEQHHLPTVGGGVFSDPMQQRVADLAGRQIQVRLLGAGDRKQDLLEACLLAEDHEVEGLPRFKSLGDRRRLQVGDIGNGDVDADGDQSPGLNLALWQMTGSAFRLSTIRSNSMYPSQRAALPATSTNQL